MGFRPFRSVAGTVAVLTAVALHAQSPHFEVASIKLTPADSHEPGRITRPAGGQGYHGTNMPLEAYIRVAFQVRTSQITGPDWIMMQNYDVEAKAGDPATVDELHVMLQNLLEERFHMKIRHEQRDQSGYVLVVDKGGSKMADHDPSDRVTLPISPGPGMHTGTNVTMTYLAFYLSQELDKKVVDKTGLDGHYDFQLEWNPDRQLSAELPAGGEPPRMEMRDAQFAASSGIPNALRQQLGLRLDAAKLPVEHIVIEHIEKLIEN